MRKTGSASMDTGTGVLCWHYLTFSFLALTLQDISMPRAAPVPKPNE